MRTEGMAEAFQGFVVFQGNIEKHVTSLHELSTSTRTEGAVEAFQGFVVFQATTWKNASPEETKCLNSEGTIKVKVENISLNHSFTTVKVSGGADWLNSSYSRPMLWLKNHQT